MKCLIVFVSLFCLAMPVMAQTNAYRYSLGSGLDITDGAFDNSGTELLIFFENRLNRLVSVGSRGMGTVLDFGHGFNYSDPDYVSVYEALALIRFYPLAAKEQKDTGVEPFLEAQGGLIAKFVGYKNGVNAQASPEGGGVLGVRFVLGRLFIEAYGRIGYPYYVGGGLVAGARFTFNR